jgi:hypothetical protein
MREAKVGILSFFIFLLLAVTTQEHVRSLILGMVTGEFNVTIAPVNMIFINIFLSNQTLVLGDVENITVYTYNTGSVVADPTQTKLTVYLFNGTELLQRAFYSDSITNYYPGIKKQFSTTFVPTEGGIYFVKSNISYGLSVFETWNAFVVFTVSNETSSGITAPSGAGSGTGGGGGGGGGVGANRTVNEIIVQVPKMNISYPKIVRVGQGDSTIFAINVMNTGTAYLHNLRAFLSASYLFEFEVNPKQVNKIGPVYDYLSSQNTTFLVSVKAPDDVPPGKYPFTFRIISDQLSSSGELVIEVLPRGALNIDDIRQRLLSYSIIILDIEHQMLSAQERGVDVSQANESLSGAKTELEEARKLLNEGRFEEARYGLDKVKKNLERATLQLASADFFVYKPASIPYLYIAAASVAVAGTAYYIYYRWKSKRRPRLIRGIEVEKSED